MFLSWSPDDQDKALAWNEIQGATCPECGTIPSDWMDEGKPRTPEPYIVESIQCVGCQRLDETREVAYEGQKDSAKGLKFFLRKPGE